MIGRAVNKTPRKFSLRTSLVVPFVLQVVTAVGLVGYLSFRNGQRAVDNLANQLNREISKRIEQQVLNYLEETHHLIDATYSAIQSGNLDPEDFEAFRRYLWQVVHQQRLTNYLYYGTKQGEFIGVERIEDGTVQLKMRTQDSAPNRETYLLNEQGEPQKRLKSSEYDPRSRPWYEAAKAAGNSTWSEIFASFSRQNNSLEISPVKPVYDWNGKLQGVLSVNLRLVLVADFLKSLYISPNGQTFIIERAGDLIATSTVSQPFTIVGEGDNKEIKRLRAIESGNVTVQAIAQSLLKQFGSFNAIHESQHLKLLVNGQQYYTEVLPIRDGRGIDWLAVVIVPENDFMAQINANTRTTLLLCLLTFAGATAIGILTSRWVTRPILRVSQASDNLAQGDLNQQVEPSLITEIDTLAASFNTMAKQLKESFDALRQSEATNRAIVTTIPDLMIRAKGDGTYLDIVGRDRLRGVYGVQRFSTGSTVQESLPPDLAKMRMHHIQQALTTGELQVYEHRIVLNGQSQDEEVRILVLGDDEVLIMVRDITDRKQAEAALRIAEENYRSIFENALEGIFQSSPEGHFTRVNPAMAKIFGYDSPEEMLANITNIAAQLHVDPQDQEIFIRTMAEDDRIKDFEYRTYQQDGNIIWVQEDTRAVRDQYGTLLYYEGIVQDISDRKRREDELRRQLEELKIEIDQKKREKEVAMLTESSYFQEVQQEMTKMNLDEFWS